MSTPVAGFNNNPQNINRNGAPKKSWTMKGLIEEALEEATETGEEKKKLVAKKLVDLALAGEIVAIKEVNNRIDGMPQQDIKAELSVEGVIIYKPEKNEE